MVVATEFSDSISKRLLAEEDHLLEAFFLDGSHESLYVGRQVWGPRREPDGCDAGLLQDFAKRVAELVVSIHEQVASTQKESVEWVREVLAYLLHPVLVRVRCATCEVNATCRHFHHKKQIEGDESAFCPDFDCREIDGAQNIPVGFQEGFPSALTLSLRRWLDAVFFQDVADGLIGYLMSEVGQRPLNTVVAPGGIVLSHPQDELYNVFGDGWPSLLYLSAMAEIPFISYQLAMPTQDGIGSDDRGYFQQGLTPQELAFDGQAAPLIVVQEDAFLAELLHQHLDLCTLKLNDRLLVPIKPSGQNNH